MKLIFGGAMKYIVLPFIGRVLFVAFIGVWIYYGFQKLKPKFGKPSANNKLIRIMDKIVVYVQNKLK